jgi:hypothetical protein
MASGTFVGTVRRVSKGEGEVRIDYEDKYGDPDYGWVGRSHYEAATGQKPTAGTEVTCRIESGCFGGLIIEGLATPPLAKGEYLGEVVEIDREEPAVRIEYKKDGETKRGWYYSKEYRKAAGTKPAVGVKVVCTPGFGCGVGGVVLRLAGASK